jgi:uncharacterized protein (TIGR04255 family)
MSPTSYSKPPIAEALLDIQVKLDSGFSVEKLKKCHAAVNRDYPRVDQRNLGTFRATMGAEVSSTASLKQMGFIFTSEDKSQLFQARLDGFTFNRLAPYPGWPTFVAEAQRLWDVYRQVADPQEYLRIALRTINRVDFPLSAVRLEDYFRTYPEVSPELPQFMNGFFFEFNLPLLGKELAANITQTSLPPTAPGQTSIVLDIDLFRVGNVSDDQL